uniref:Uncharacterized protein n=1 Tax=Arundo donax TaxID=35708 RepID=A0A0A9F0D9_ARUDO
MLNQQHKVQVIKLQSSTEQQECAY